MAEAPSHIGSKHSGATTMEGVQLVMTLWQLLKNANAMLHTSFRGPGSGATIAQTVKASETECVRAAQSTQEH
jgi:hypothetical protein